MNKHQHGDALNQEVLDSLAEVVDDLTDHHLPSAKTTAELNALLEVDDQ
ncbi:hypothetical protein [Schleiferilactobacillus harbinensis]|jgi:hypothetical protein|nr:hypothetical protein [Schleiferilactobacillus harbinensis]